LRTFFLAATLALTSLQAVALVKEVEEMPTRFIESFRQGDLPALIGWFAPDASYIPTAGKSRFDGVEGIRG
jgi:ketosteroid isomerase-like protein